MKILIVDDEYAALRNLQNHLQRNKWQTTLADNYETAKQKIMTEEFDAIVCDYHLSHDTKAKHGLDLIREIRKSGIKTPVIFLTGFKIDEITPWAALNGGGDDFLRKPWRPEELIARIQAVVRRGFSCDDNSTNILRHGDITLDLGLRKTFIQGEEVHLGNILFLLMKKFLQKPGALLSYDALISYLWGGNFPVSPGRKNTLRVHMTHLKKSIGGPHARHIRTVHGEGYVWEN